MAYDPSSQRPFSEAGRNNEKSPETPRQVGANPADADYTRYDTPYGSYDVPVVYVDGNGHMKTYGGNMEECGGYESAEAAARKLEEHKAKGPQSFEYLVRGAALGCQFGSHRRYLNLPRCHGVYVRGKPLIHERDCLVGDDKNIPTFGVCQCPGNPSGASITATRQDAKTKETISATGKPCKPAIIKYWRATSPQLQIGDNLGDGEEAALVAGAHYPAATMNSFLICRYGGIIRPFSSGQTNDKDNKVKPDANALTAD